MLTRHPGPGRLPLTRVGDARVVRVAIVTESFLPSVNGVTTSVCRVAECLRDEGHTALVVAPGPAPDLYAGHPVRALPGVPVRQFRMGLPTPEVVRALRRFRPDVVHAASPFVVGAGGLAAAAALGVPSVAVYQTDMPSYLEQHAPGALGRGAARAAWGWIRRVHARADLTLAPSQPTLDELRAQGVPRTALWGRGVDTTLFRPEVRDDPATAELRRTLAPGGERLLGYVGRLAPEKELHRLVEVAAVPGTRLVVVGEGPSRSEVGARLARAVADAPGRPNLPPVFLGHRGGAGLAQAYAALDVFVHTGTRETFGQTLQEAAATGLPVVAPARGGPLDLVAHGSTGYLYDPDVPGDLARWVEHLVDDPAMRERLGTAGVAAVRDRSWERVTAELLAHYSRVRSAAGAAA